ncbi:6490_t:CDS:10, partial [Funneliformis mosseae]
LIHRERELKNIVAIGKFTLVFSSPVPFHLITILVLALPSTYLLVIISLSSTLMTTVENTLGFSYWKETPPESWDPLLPQTLAKKQLEWLSMHGNHQERQRALVVLAKHEVDLKKNGRIYQFWGSDVVTETQIRMTRSRYKLTVANEVTEQMTSIAQTATKDVKRSFPGHEDDKVKRVRLNEEVCNCLLLKCDDSKEENVEAHSKQNDAVRNLLDESEECSHEMQEILANFQTYRCEANNILLENGIMDLRPSSEFVLLYTEETNYDKMIQDIFNPVDKLFPEDAHEFLINFFLEKLNEDQWESKLESLMEANCGQNGFLKRLKRLMLETLPILIRSKNRDMTEEEYMNTFVHPVLKKAYARFTHIPYVPGSKAIKASAYRKSLMNQKGNADRADGIAYTSNRQNSYEIAVVEGSRPYVTDQNKETSDFIQNARAGKDIINFVVTQEVMLKRALPSSFRAFMAQSCELQLHFYFMDYLAQYRIFEIETCEVPTDWSETNLFPSFYQAIVTWVLLVEETDKQFQASRSKRSSRLSNSHNIRKLTTLTHNKARPGTKRDMKMAKLL